MIGDKTTLQPLGEVFGFPIENETERAKRFGQINYVRSTILFLAVLKIV